MSASHQPSRPLGWARDDALGKRGRDRQPLIGIERLGRPKVIARAFRDDLGIALGRPLGAGVGACWPKPAGEGRLIVAVARSIGNTQPLPVTFQ